MCTNIAVNKWGVVSGAIWLAAVLTHVPVASLSAQTAPGSTPLPTAAELTVRTPNPALKLTADQSAYSLLGLDNEFNSILARRRSGETSSMLLCSLTKVRLADCLLPPSNNAASPPVAVTPPTPEASKLPNSLRAPIELAPATKLQATAPQQDTVGAASVRVLSAAGAGSAAFKGYKFSNIGTLAELQQGMRSLGVAESVVARDAPKLMQVIKSTGGRYGLLMVAVAGGGYALYEAWSGPGAKK